MRFSAQEIPVILLVLLPLVVAYNGCGVIWTLFSLIVLALLRQTLLLQGLMSRDKQSGYVLESIGLSHYVDKVRWSMDLLGIEYTEEQDAGIIGVFYGGRMVPGLRVPRHNFTIYNSRDILRYLYGMNVNDQKIERFLRPTPEAIELEKKIDKMGDDARRFAYSQIFHGPESDAMLLRFWGCLQDDKVVPQWQKILLKVSLPILKIFMMKVLKLTIEDGREGLRLCKDGIFKEVDAMLSDGRKYLLNTDEPTYIDVAFASLAAALAIPDGYAGYKAVNDESRLQLKYVKSQEAVKEIEKFRQTNSGKFVFRMYKDFRKNKTL